MTRPWSFAAAQALLAAAAVLAALGCRGRISAPHTSQAAAPAPAAQPTSSPTRIFLFFPGDDTLLHREIRELPELAAATTTRIRTVVEELVAGSQNGLAPAFPWAATVETVFADGNGDAFVDLSAPPAGAVQGSDGELMLTYAVVNSVVANCSGIERVQLLFGGREVSTLGHLDLSRPLAARPQLVAP
jgi:hypothetical protein